jgi:hypothetical protein
VPEQQLHRREVVRAPVDQRCLGAAQRVRAVGGGVGTDAPDPALDDARVLPGGEMRRSVLAAREELARGR